MRTITGLMDVNEIDVASKVPGRIKELLVREGDSVTEGQKLLTIESHEIAAKLEQVQAATDAARAKLRMAQKGPQDEEKRAAENALQAAQHQREIAQKTYDRMAALFADKAIPQAKLDEADFNLKMAKEQLSVAQNKLTLIQRGARKEELEALNALVRQGKGSLEEVKSYASETLQVAPISGEVAKIMLHPGELAATGYPILSLVDLSKQWATFVLREDMLQKIKKGDTIEVEIPALGRTARMTIFHIAVMGDFATWRATSEKNSFDLKTFEVRAQPNGPVENLRPGMTVRWKVAG